MQHFLRIILSGSVEKASDQGGGVGRPASDVEGRGIGEAGGDGAGGCDAGTGSKSGVGVGVFGAGVSYSPVKDREELSWALSEQVCEIKLRIHEGRRCLRFLLRNHLVEVQLRIGA